MGQPYLDQDNWRIGDDDNSDPDSCTWRGSCGSSGYTYAKETPFQVRLTVSNTGNKTSGSITWSLYYNTTDDRTVVGGALQVTTSSNVIRIVSGTPTDGAATDTQVCAGTGTRKDGEYNDANDTITNFELTGTDSTAQWSELQFCVQFQSDATADQTYYFFLYPAKELDAASAGGAQATVSAPAALTIDVNDVMSTECTLD